MCRFTLYLGPEIRISSLVTEPAHSLIHQSFHSHEREEPLNGDGFGLAWYAPEMSEQPAVFRSTTPAWSNRNLLELARVTMSPCILAHVRAATRAGTTTETNCHPFSWGPYAFMHNGDVGGFDRVRRRLVEDLSDRSFHEIEGTTDSEHLFALFLDMVEGVGEGDPAAAMAEGIRRTVDRVVELSERHGGGEPSYLNMAVSDGRRAVVTRYTSDAPEHSETLYLNVGRRYICQDGEGRMLPCEEGAGATVVSSEPLSDDPGWEIIPANHLVVIRDDGRAEVRALP